MDPKRYRQAPLGALLLVLALACSGCEQFFIDSADQIATRIIQHRQQQALGINSNFDIGEEKADRTRSESMYDFVPHPVDNEVPEAFHEPRELKDDESLLSAGSNGLNEQTADSASGEVPTFTLADALNYAFQHARDFQTQKEQLYLTALALMNERQLWTPQLVAEVRTEYVNWGQENSFDQAMDAVSDVSVTQNLPYGGQIAARVVNSLMRDLSHHVTTGETGSMILEANIPLLRGAGRVAYESRYQAERDLIYAVRDFENARRDLVVQVSGSFFDLMVAKTRIASAISARDNAVGDVERAKAFFESDRTLAVEYDRARVQYLSKANQAVNAQVNYRTSLDNFKVQIGMPTTEHLEVAETELQIFEPDVNEAQAQAAAAKYRLDLLNVLDEIDDSRRDVQIAKNNLLPQFDLSGSVSMQTDPEHANSLSYNTERTVWRGGAALEIPIDRREERNLFRASLIGLRRAERNYVQSSEEVRVEVRNAFRRLEQARISMKIQEENIGINEFRASQARALFDRGRLSSNRDVVEAENELQDSRNAFAEAMANYRLEILRFLRATGTLRVGDNGQFVGPAVDLGDDAATPPPTAQQVSTAS